MSTKNEIESAKADIQKLINDINQLANNIEKDFVNIGNDHIADSLRSTASYYRRVRKNLDNLLVL